MTHSNEFLESTARDYGMTVEQVKFLTRHCQTSSEFYDALEHDIKRGKK